MQKYRNLLFLFAIVIVGIFLRIYKIDTNYYFSGELGKEMLYISQFAIAHSFPLVGMSTSHPWLSYGAFYYWIMIPIFNIFSGNPFILFWTAVVVSVLGMVLNYLVFKKVAGEKIAILSTIIQSISPLFIWQTTLSKLHVFFWILIPFFTYALFMLWNGRKKWIFWSGII